MGGVDTKKGNQKKKFTWDSAEVPCKRSKGVVRSYSELASGARWASAAVVYCGVLPRVAVCCSELHCLVCCAGPVVC